MKKSMDMPTQKYRLTILGLGNILFKDEGFGVHFVNEFKKKYHLPDDVLILDGGTLGYILMDTICQTEQLIVIDTVKADDKPGAVYRFRPDAIPSCLNYNVSAHEVEFLDVLFKAEMMEEAPNTIIIAVVPEDIKDTGLDLTPRIKASLPVVEAFVKKELKEMGIQPIVCLNENDD
jgi:hydrogenase maturation protease